MEKHAAEKHGTGQGRHAVRSPSLSRRMLLGSAGSAFCIDNMAKADIDGLLAIGYGELSDSTVDLAERPPEDMSISLPNYAGPGPCQPLRMPRLEHTCTTCNVSADRCRIRINAWIPKGGIHIGLDSPFPLAIITPGFLISSDQYTSYAERLASWGYVVVMYDMTQQALDPTTDLSCVALLEDLIEWCRTSYPLGKLCDTENIFLMGHSRGAKISTLVASQDPRVKALYLIDPVDVTVYTPLSPEYPSASEALSHSKVNSNLPVAIIGGGHGGDCAPSDSSFDTFFRAARGPTWEAIVRDAGHLQFLDARNATAMGLVCQASSDVTDMQVEDVAHTMAVTWAETMVKRKPMVVKMSETEYKKLPQRIAVSGRDGKLTVVGDSTTDKSFSYGLTRSMHEISRKAASVPIAFNSKNIVTL